MIIHRNDKIGRGSTNYSPSPRHCGCIAASCTIHVFISRSDVVCQFCRLNFCQWLLKLGCWRWVCMITFKISWEKIFKNKTGRKEEQKLSSKGSKSWVGADYPTLVRIQNYALVLQIVVSDACDNWPDVSGFQFYPFLLQPVLVQSKWMSNTPSLGEKTYSPLLRRWKSHSQALLQKWQIKSISHRKFLDKTSQYPPDPILHIHKTGFNCTLKAIS